MSPSDARITRDDLEAKFREFEGPAGAKVDSTKQGLRALVIAGVALVVIGAYLIGRRRGNRRNRTVVEVHRL